MKELTSITNYNKNTTQSPKIQKENQALIEMQKVRGALMSFYPFIYNRIITFPE
jgi:hypothetical protein